MSPHDNEFKVMNDDKTQFNERKTKNVNPVFIYDDNLSKEEIKKLKIKSKNLSNRIEFILKDYDNLSKKVYYDLKDIDEKYHEDFNSIINDVNSKIEDLLDYDSQCNNLNIIDDLIIKVDDINKDFKTIKKEHNQKVFKIKELVHEKIREKSEDYNELKIEVELILENKLDLYSQFNPVLFEMINNTKDFSPYIDKNELFDNLKKISVEANLIFNKLTDFEKQLDHMSIENYHSVEQVNDEIDNLNYIINELNQIDIDSFVEKIKEQEIIYEDLLVLNDKFASENVENLLIEFEECFNRPIFKRQLKKFNLDENELDIVKNDIIDDIINQVIVDGSDFRGIIKIRCREFRKNNFELDENEINNQLNNMVFPEVDDDIVSECKDKVKKDLLEGNITINQLELKLRNYINKKINESNQLKELDRIKNNPDVPSVKIHLTPEEINKIYIRTEDEILSEYGIRGNVEDRVYYLMNKKIRENQSEARGRLNVIKRDFSSIIQLNKKEQVEFMHKIEFLINTNDIKHDHITEEHIIKFSEDYIRYGEIRLG